ncbi:hypothetical protein THAOC_31792, partial [Thalassiosira oceanica]
MDSDNATALPPSPKSSRPGPVRLVRGTVISTLLHSTGSGGSSRESTEKGYPLNIEVAELQVEETTVDKQFLLKLLPKINYPALKSAVMQISNHCEPPLPAIPEELDVSDGDRLMTLDFRTLSTEDTKHDIARGRDMIPCTNARGPKPCAQRSVKGKEGKEQQDLSIKSTETGNSSIRSGRLETMEMRRLLLDEVAAIIAGTLSGAKYGLKIRLPHATVMTFLFAKQLTFREKSKTIAKLTAEHATNLAAFVFIYKFGVRYSSVNYQMILYLASRILVGSIKLAREKGVKPFSWSGASFGNTYPLAAAGIWGTVLYLFEQHPN